MLPLQQTFLMGAMELPTTAVVAVQSKSNTWQALKPLKSHRELLVVHLISFLSFSSLQFSAELFSSFPLSFCHPFLWTSIGVSGKCVFNTYRERPLYPRRNLYYIAQSPLRICLCFSILASSFCASLSSSWLAFPIFLNPSCQLPTHTSYYVILSAAFPGQGLNGNGLAGLNFTMLVRTTGHRVNEPCVKH